MGIVVCVHAITVVALIINSSSLAPYSHPLLPYYWFINWGKREFSSACLFSYDWASLYYLAVGVFWGRGQVILCKVYQTCIFVCDCVVSIMGNMSVKELLKIYSSN